MKSSVPSRRGGFTLVETVIALGVLVVLLTAFMYVFGPAMTGIRKSINVQEADRLATALERELGTLRSGQESGGIKTGFGKAFEWIKNSTDGNNAICVYQYRGNPNKQRADGTLEPEVKSNGVPGRDYIVQPIARRVSDQNFAKDMEAVVGPVFAVKCKQLTYNGSDGLVTGKGGEIKDPEEGTTASSSDAYTDAVLAFSAEFYSMPSNSSKYFQGDGFKKRFRESSKPIFARNLAVRR